MSRPLETSGIAFFTRGAMREIDPKTLRGLEAQARSLGKTLDDAINPPSPATGKRRRKIGFALLLFSFDGPELTWLSNAERKDMIRLLDEILLKMKAGRMDDFPGGVDAGN